MRYSLRMLVTATIVVIGWIFSLCLHEFSHALVAYLGGDTSVRDKGYLTFNPFKYTNPLLSLILPVVFVLMGGIGLPGGAVYIQYDRLRGKHWRSAVALAGPLSNALLAVVFGVIASHWEARADPLAPPPTALTAFELLAQLQVAAVVLNLIPLPPLDGYGIFSPYLPKSTQAAVAGMSGFTLLALFAVLWGFPQANRLYWSTVDTIGFRIGIDPYMAQIGWDHMPRLNRG